MSDLTTKRPSNSPRPLILPSLFAPPSRPTATMQEKSTHPTDNLTSVPLGPSPLPAPVTCGNPPPWTLPTYLRFPSTSTISTKRRMRPSITISHAGGGVAGDRQPRYALLLAIATLVLFCLTFPLPPLLQTDTIHSHDHASSSYPSSSQGSSSGRLGIFELPIQKSVWMRYEHLPRPALLRLASFGRFASSSSYSSAPSSSTVRVGGVGETAAWTTDDEHIDELSPLHDDLGIGISMRGLAHPKRPKGIVIPGSYEHRQKLHPRDLHRRSDARRSRVPESYRRDMDAEEMARYTRRRGDQGRALAGVAAVVRPHKRMF